MPEKDLYQISLKLLLKNAAGETLILNAHPDGTYAAFYDLPGGRIDEPEIHTPIEDILRREVSEELGAVTFTCKQKPVALGRHVVPAELSPNGKELHVMYIFFEGTMTGGEITISEEHIGTRWVDLRSCNLKELFISGILEGIEQYLTPSIE